ncbi:hypothetical protein [Treponema sp. C6A8]|uniref:hypothetical protein n=1 Tax=Treponema sp. C6A8 TaxID=1410609 RepID=UPI000488EC89|nr:hypothetical protein [Treponema sp. C6A8]
MNSFEVTNQMLDEFRQSASPYLTDIEKIEYKNSQESHIQKKNRDCSILKIHISSKTEYQKLNLDPIYENWDDVFPYTKEIKSIWNSLLRKYKSLDSYDTKIGYVFFSCVETDTKYKIAYNSKDEIHTKLECLGLPKFRHIFCDSEIEYSLLLKNEKDYNKYVSFSIEKIKDLILQILNSKCLGLNYKFSLNDFKCHLYHEKMKGLDLYGLSRED